MHQLYSEEEIFFSSRTRRSRTFICLVLLSVAVVVFLITSVVFVTLYCLEQGSHSKPIASINSMNASRTNHNIQCTQESQSTAWPSTSQSTARPTTSKSTAGTFTSLSAAKLKTSLSAARLTTTLMGTAGPQIISLSTAAQNISRSTPEPKLSLRLQRPKTPDTPTSLKLKYCGSKACQFASIGRKKYIFKSEIIAHIYQAGEGIPVFSIIYRLLFLRFPLSRPFGHKHRLSKISYIISRLPKKKFQELGMCRKPPRKLARFSRCCFRPLTVNATLSNIYCKIIG